MLFGTKKRVFELLASGYFWLSEHLKLLVLEGGMVLVNALLQG